MSYLIYLLVSNLLFCNKTTDTFLCRFRCIPISISPHSHARHAGKDAMALLVLGKKGSFVVQCRFISSEVVSLSLWLQGLLAVSPASCSCGRCCCILFG